MLASFEAFELQRVCILALSTLYSIQTRNRKQENKAALWLQRQTPLYGGGDTDIEVQYHTAVVVVVVRHSMHPFLKYRPYYFSCIRTFCSKTRIWKLPLYSHHTEH